MEKSGEFNAHYLNPNRYEDVKVKIEIDDNLYTIQPESNANPQDNVEHDHHETKSRISENVQFDYLENQMKIDIQRQENKNYKVDISEQIEIKRENLKDVHDYMETKCIEDNYDLAEIKMDFEEQTVQQDVVPKFLINNIEPVEKIFKCELCGKSFKTRVYLNKHKKSTHTECRNYKCSICGRAFKKRSHLKRHNKIHTSGFAYYLIIYQKKNYNFEHILDDNPYACDLCEKSFGTYSCLVRHKLCHTEHRNYKCTMCNEAYKSIAYLNAHIKRVHTESRNFKCDICEATFKTNSDLNNHGRVHTDERPFPCVLCNKGFKRHSSLSKHFRTRLHKKHLKTV